MADKKERDDSLDQISERESVDPAPSRKISRTRKVVFALVTVLGFFVAIEGVLRISGFQAVADVERMQFTFPVDEYNQKAGEPFLLRDPDVFWKPRPGALGHNSHGFNGPEFQTEKPPGVFRIVCLGDSCTHWGPQAYPEILQRLLDEKSPGKFEVINAGVIGYTSYQGMRVMQTRVTEWDPDLVTVYFGWNDHWHARGLMDKDQTVSESNAATSLAASLRTVQLIQLLSGRLDQKTDQMRVEIPDYKHNLSAIEKECVKLNCQTWFLTAPHAMDLYVPPYLVESGEVTDPGNLANLHRSYNDAVRSIAKESDSQLVDFEKVFDGQNKRSLFMDDNIHLNLQGRELAATILAQAILNDENLMNQAKTE